MANKGTAIGRMFRTEPARARVELAEVFTRNDGNMVRAAHELALSRRQLYRLTYRATLWEHVDEIRAARRKRWTSF